MRRGLPVRKVQELSDMALEHDRPVKRHRLTRILGSGPRERLLSDQRLFRIAKILLRHTCNTKRKILKVKKKIIKKIQFF